jgi:hypothetical protein
MFTLTFLGMAALTPHGSVFAGQLVDPSTLNPPPPSFESCEADGSNIICRGGIPPQAYGPSDNQIFCGTGANAFDTFDSGVDSEKATRYYDANLNLERRVIIFDDDGQWSNARTGVSVPYEQHQIITDVLGVPGDLSTITETKCYQMNVTGNRVYWR